MLSAPFWIGSTLCLFYPLPTSFRFSIFFITPTLNLFPLQVFFLLFLVLFFPFPTLLCLCPLILLLHPHTPHSPPPSFLSYSLPASLVLPAFCLPKPKPHQQRAKSAAGRGGAEACVTARCLVEVFRRWVKRFFGSLDFFFYF